MLSCGSGSWNLTPSRIYRHYFSNTIVVESLTIAKNKSSAEGDRFAITPILRGPDGVIYKIITGTITKEPIGPDAGRAYFRVNTKCPTSRRAMSKNTLCDAPDSIDGIPIIGYSGMNEEYLKLSLGYVLYQGGIVDPLTLIGPSQIPKNTRARSYTPGDRRTILFRIPVCITQTRFKTVYTQAGEEISVSINGDLAVSDPPDGKQTARPLRLYKSITGMNQEIFMSREEETEYYYTGDAPIESLEGVITRVKVTKTPPAIFVPTEPLTPPIIIKEPNEDNPNGSSVENTTVVGLFYSEPLEICSPCVRYLATRVEREYETVLKYRWNDIWFYMPTSLGTGVSGHAFKPVLMDLLRSQKDPYSYGKSLGGVEQTIPIKSPNPGGDPVDASIKGIKLAAPTLVKVLTKVSVSDYFRETESITLMVTATKTLDLYGNYSVSTGAQLITGGGGLSGSFCSEGMLYYTIPGEGPPRTSGLPVLIPIRSGREFPGSVFSSIKRIKTLQRADIESLTIVGTDLEIEGLIISENIDYVRNRTNIVRKVLSQEENEGI